MLKEIEKNIDEILVYFLRNVVKIFNDPLFKAFNQIKKKILTRFAEI